MGSFWSSTTVIHIANGCDINVFCRFTSDEILVTHSSGGGGLKVAGVDVKGNKKEEYDHRFGGGDGYTAISSGSTMQFDITGKTAYLTLISEKGNKVCVNHQVNLNRSFVVSYGFHLKNSSDGDIWTDIDGMSYTEHKRVPRVVNGGDDMLSKAVSLSLDPNKLFEAVNHK